MHQSRGIKKAVKKRNQSICRHQRERRLQCRETCHLSIEKEKAKHRKTREARAWRSELAGFRRTGRVGRVWVARCPPDANLHPPWTPA